MRSEVWKKSNLIMVSLFLVLSFVNIVVATDANPNGDRAITSKVNDKLQSDSQLQGSIISVDTKDGEVTLKGIVKSQADIIRAAEIAHYVDGVKQVDNRLETEKAYSSSSSHYGLTDSTCIVGPSWC